MELKPEHFITRLIDAYECEDEEEALEYFEMFAPSAPKAIESVTHIQVGAVTSEDIIHVHTLANVFANLGVMDSRDKCADVEHIMKESGQLSTENKSTLDACITSLYSSQ